MGGHYSGWGNSIKLCYFVIEFKITVTNENKSKGFSLIECKIKTNFKLYGKMCEFLMEIKGSEIVK